MTLRTRSRPYWLCRRCGHRNERRWVNCRGENCQSKRPKKRVPVHARVLRDNSYEALERLSQQIHGGDLGACGYCGKPKPEGRRHDRDHDHKTGQFRGLACFHCNREKLRHHTLETMQAGVRYLTRARIVRVD